MSAIQVPAIEVTQHNEKMYLFSMKASKIWEVVQINKREENKETGYQRAFSEVRGKKIRNYIIFAKGIIAPAIIIAFDKASFDPKTKMLTIQEEEDAGWIIDGQHRLRGAELASKDENAIDLELAVIAFLNIDEDSQIEQFITINKEAKNVPTSLFLDLLPSLPKSKTEKEILEEKATNIARTLKDDSESIFYGRIVFVGSPKANYTISLTNFVRKIHPLLRDGNMLTLYTHQEVIKILDNYFKALKLTFHKEFLASRNIMFSTLYFGALINLLLTVFEITYKRDRDFTINSIKKTLSYIKDFDLSTLKQKGSGSKAEIEAGKELCNALKKATKFQTQEPLLKL